MLSTIRRNAAFSLIELVIVVVIIGIIAAIAIPRMSRGAEGAADGALTADLTTLRNAIDLYHAEHAGNYPDLVATPTQLTQFTDDSGAVSATKTATHIYGPYVRGAIPKLPVGTNRGQSAFVATLGGTTAGWVYVKATGTVSANLPNAEADVRGTPYNQY